MKHLFFIMVFLMTAIIANAQMVETDSTSQKEVENHATELKKEQKEAEKTAKELKKQADLKEDIERLEKKISQDQRAIEKTEKQLQNKAGKLSEVDRKKMELKMAKSRERIEKNTTKLKKLRKKI